MSGAPATASPSAPATRGPACHLERKPRAIPPRVGWLLALLAILALAGCDMGGAQATPTPTVAQGTATIAAPTIAAPTIAATPSVEAAAQPTATQATGANTPAAATTATAGGAAGATFTNPVLRSDFADPFVLKDGDVYYGFATNASGK
ncbi:MAG: hypothetical protein M3328_09800, partial [Chloroflexota bacterium]|nr:hypothetical protein [Chloroflexota bacterium]